MGNEHNASENNHSLEGRYANYFKVGHNQLEFILDFGQYYPEDGDPRFHTRIITSPAHAEAFMRALQEAVEESKNFP